MSRLRPGHTAMVGEACRTHRRVGSVAVVRVRAAGAGSNLEPTVHAHAPPLPGPHALPPDKCRCLFMRRLH